MLWKEDSPASSDLVKNRAQVGLRQNSSSQFLYKRLIWEKVERIISHVQTTYPDLQWARILDPWVSRNTEYFVFEDIWDYFESPVSFCSMIYIHESMADVQDRIALIRMIEGPQEHVAIAKAFGFFRLFDVCSYFTSLYNNQTYTPLYFRLKTKRINKYITLANDIINNIKFLPKQYIVEDFLSLSIRLFYRFRVELGERFYIAPQILEKMEGRSHKMAELDSEGQSWSPLHTKGNTEYDHDLPGIRLRKSSGDDINHNACRQFLENNQVYDRPSTQRRIIQRQAIQFCLTYLLHDCLEIARPGYKNMIQNTINIIQLVNQTTKRFWRLDPRSFVEYYQKSQAFYFAIFKIYRDVIEFRRNSIVSMQSVGPILNSYYLAYTEQLGHHIKYGQITTNKMDNDKSFLTVDDRFEYQYPVPQTDYVQIILPGFINLHTHTKFNFQGNVNFGTKFSNRFEWRQIEYEGKHVVGQDKILHKLCSPETKPKSEYDIFRTDLSKNYSEADFHKFKRYIKMYTHLQAVISGTTSIFMECQYQKKQKYPEIIRSTIIKDPNSKNITSNDLYVIWRNQKNKDNLIMIWSKDFIKFLTEVIGIEIQILLQNQKNRINLHVHLAEGKSDAYVTICEFDNFCYDIICLEHFIRHIKDRLDKFEKGNIRVICDSKIVENFGVSIISAENADRTYRCELQIKKMIVKSDSSNGYKTNLDMTIVEQTDNHESNIKQQKVKNLKQPELTQIYKLQTIRGNLLIIHANGFQWQKPLHRYLLETYETNICVSPFSNLSLYGTVRDFNWPRWILDSSYKKYRKYLCLGTDWNPTGKQNVLQQARYLLKQMRSNNVNIDRDTVNIVYDMTTINPARVTKMSIGMLKDSFQSDFWIGRFPKKLLFENGEFKNDANKLIEYVLRQFDYQNNIMQVYCAGQLVYSQTAAPGLQEITLKNELNKYFHNPEGVNNFQFQQYVQTIRDTLTQDFQSNISLLFP